MKAIRCICFLLLLSPCLYSQFEGSDIPLVVIETNGGFPIPDEPKTKAYMKIIDHGPGGWNEPSDPGNDYSAHIGIEIRGAYSSTLPQKPYGFETRDPYGNEINVSLLGLPAENDWIFLANYNDKSFLRNSLASRLESHENTGDELSGGYIFKTDYYGSGDHWKSQYSPALRPEAPVYFVYEYPGPDEITLAQKSYIRSYVDAFEQALYGSNFTDYSTGYKAYLDLKSFRDYFILSELSRNVDAYKKSRFLYKDRESRGGRIYSGPAWDYDWAWKDIWDCHMFANTDGSGWAYRVNECDVWPVPPVWMIRLLEDEHFANRLKRRYVDLRKNVLSKASLFAYIDSVSNYLEEAQQRHYQKWDILGENVGAPEVGYIPGTFSREIDKLKNWISTRLAWLDTHMPGDANGPLHNQENRTAQARLFPNPASDIVYLESDTPLREVAIYSLAGRKVYQNSSPNSFGVKVDLQSYPSGMYLVKMQLDSGEVISHKLIKR